MGIMAMWLDCNITKRSDPLHYIGREMSMHQKERVTLARAL